MRITFVISNANLSGGVRAVAVYARKLHELGHQITIVSRPRPVPVLRKRIRSLLSGRGWPGRPNRRTHLDDTPARHLRIDSWRAITSADVPDGDVIIATWWETAEWVAAMDSSKGAKVYFVQHHEVVFNNQPQQRVEATYRLPMHKVCCAKWLQDLMREQYGDPTAAHVPYGVDHSLFNAPPRGRQSAPTVGVMYSRAHFKGCDVSLRAFSEAARRIPGLRLLAYSAVPQSPDLPLPPEAEFCFQPPQEKIREIYASCDAWLFASRCEGFGLPVLEAMACRTPVIATPTGAGYEAVDARNGVVVPMDDVPAMAAAIERVCTMPDARWREMSHAALQTAQQYDWDTSTRLFEAQLQRAVEQQRSAAPLAQAGMATP